MITKKIKHKDSTGVVHEYDIGADAKNISEDTTHRFVSDEEKEEWSRKMDPAGNASDSTVAFKQAASRENISTGEKMAGLFGKIAKWFADLKNHAFSDLIQNATTADTTRAVSAAVAKILQDQITAQNTNISRKVTVNTNLVISSDIACYKRGNIVYLCGNVNVKSAGQNQTIATLQDNIASGVSYFPMAGYAGKCGEGQVEKNSLKISVPAAGYYRFSCWYVSL